MGVYYIPQGIFDNVWRYFWLLFWWRGCYWHIVEDRDAAEHPTMLSTAPAPQLLPRQQRTIWPQMSMMSKLRSLVLEQVSQESGRIFNGLFKKPSLKDK